MLYRALDVRRSIGIPTPLSLSFNFIGWQLAMVALVILVGFTLDFHFFAAKTTRGIGLRQWQVGQ